MKPSPSVVPKDFDDVGGGGGGGRDDDDDDDDDNDDKVKGVNRDDDEDDAKQGIADSEDSTENSLGYPSTDPGYDEEDIGESHKILKNQSSLKPPVQKETVIEKVKEGSLKPRMDFECDTCMLRNSNEKSACSACTTPKLGAHTSQMAANRGTPSFSFGTTVTSPNLGFSFGSTASTVDAGSGSAPASNQGSC